MPKRVSARLCIVCKGYKRLCGLASCPILERMKAHEVASIAASGSVVSGATPPSVVVGERAYPRVPVLFNVPPDSYGEEAKFYDDPESWWGKLPLRDIVRLRSRMISSIIRADVNDPWTLYEKEISLALVSCKSVASEVKLARVPKPRMSFDGILTPVGPSAPAERISVGENPKVPGPLEKVIWDDLKAYEGVIRLYKSKLEFYGIVRALSLGLLGQLKRRRLVPTRWAITAVDSIISNELLREVKGNEIANRYEIYSSEYLGNKFTVLLAPGEYTVEWLEAWHSGSVWTGNQSKIVYFSLKEDRRGRQEHVDGGYMAARLSLLEHLRRVRRKATAIIIREITPDYYAPVGNWHIRLTMRNALSFRPVLITDKLQEAVETLREMHPALDIPGKSRLLKEMLAQEKLTKYL